MGLNRRQQAALAAKTRAPWPAVFLGVDPASRAGASVLVPEGRLLSVLLVAELETDTPQLEAVLERAAAESVRRGLYLVLAMEEWGRGGPLGLRHWLGLGAAAGAWTRALALLKLRLPGLRSRVVRVHQARWRHALLPVRFGQKVGTDGWKRLALEEVGARFPGLSVPGHNAAEALLIGAYASRAEEVGAALPVRYLKAQNCVQNCVIPARRGR